MFNVFDLDAKALVMNDSIGEPIVFDDGKSASAWCKFKMGDDPTRRLQPRPAAKDENWRERERERIASGVYSRPEYLDRLEADTDHFLHMAAKKPGQLAYTKDATKGAADLQSIISLQGYIELFWSGLSNDWKFQMLLAHNKAQEDVVDGLQFANTPDDIVKAYTNYDEDSRQVAVSCMRYRRSAFGKDSSDSLPHHPCYVYGAGDLAVAYLTNSGGQTTARALCWPDKKVYSRVYGEGIHDALKKRGYVKSSGYYNEDGPSLEGARLLRIEHDDGHRGFLVPYCDDVSSARDNGKHLILDEKGRVDLRQPDGWSNEAEEEYDDRPTCDHCEEHCDDTAEVYVGRRLSRYWCEGCREADAFYCDSSEVYCASGNVDSVEMANGETWNQYAFADHGGTCERTQEDYPTDDLEDVIVDEDGRTESWGPRAARNDTWGCEQTHELVSNDVEPAKVTDLHGTEREWAPHVARAHARGNALVVYKPKLRLPTLRGDDPGQLRLDITGEDYNHNTRILIAA